MAVQAEKTAGHPSNWLGRDLRKQDLTIDLGAAQVDALERLSKQARAQGLQLEELERRHFDDPQLNDFLAGLLREINHGRGIVVLRGFPVDRLDVDHLAFMFSGLGTHLGRSCSQSSAGDHLGHVMDRNSARGYASNRELALHCDSTETVGLLCIRESREGGDSLYASSVRVHDIITQEHPEYMPVLERGFPYHRRGEEAPGAEPITPYDVPIYSVCEGVMTCRYSRESFDVALRALGRSFTPLEAAAVAFFEAVSMRPEVRFEMRIAPGEAVFLNNFEMLHARTPYVDWDEPEKKRLMLRLWLESIPPRPTLPEVHTYVNRSGRMGIDAQEGRAPGQKQYQPSAEANRAVSVLR